MKTMLEEKANQQGTQNTMLETILHGIDIVFHPNQKQHHEKELTELIKPTKERTHYLPQLYNLTEEADRDTLQSVLQKHPHTKVIDTYDGQLKELFVLDNPSLHIQPEKRDAAFEPYRKEHYGNKPEWQAGTWAYLPWRHTLLHILDDAGYQQVRTARNKNLITDKEQKTFYNSVIGVAGQSVGNSCALSIVQTGGGKHMRIADPDTLELTNLNRIRGSIAEITNLKVKMTARQIYELDPYAKLELFKDGITEENIEAFFDGPPKLDIVIDEIDDLGLKIRMRQEAKKRGIPVVMATDNGDSGILDIERHDLDKDVPFFHGRAGKDIADRVLNKDLPLPVVGKIIGEELVGYDIAEPSMQDSLLQIGKSIPTWPQLGTAAALNGAIVAVAVRKILTRQPVVSNRANISVPQWLVPNYMSEEQIEGRKKKTKEFANEYDHAIGAFLKQAKKEKRKASKTPAHA